MAHTQGVQRLIYRALGRRIERSQLLGILNPTGFILEFYDAGGNLPPVSPASQHRLDGSGALALTLDGLGQLDELLRPRQATD